MRDKIIKIKTLLPSFIYNLLKIIYHILRFHNLINPLYSSSNKITFGNEETGNFLKSKILNSKIFLEFGSGNTTIIAEENKLNYYSIESDKNFFTYLKKNGVKKIHFYSLGYVEFYSYPLLKSSLFKNYYKSKAKKYASDIFNKLNKDFIFPDLIMVDGRYRVLCMLNIFKFLKINKLFETCVILDDYSKRDYYNEIQNFFKISLSGRMAVCFINENKSLSDLDNLIEKYSDDPR